MKTKIYLVKSYMRFNDDVTPTWRMRNRSSVLYATSTKEEAAEDVRDLVKSEKREACDLYKKYFFIEEIKLFKALSND